MDAIRATVHGIFDIVGYFLHELAELFACATSLQFFVFAFQDLLTLCRKGKVTIQICCHPGSKGSLHVCRIVIPCFYLLLGNSNKVDGVFSSCFKRIFFIENTKVSIFQNRHYSIAGTTWLDVQFLLPTPSLVETYKDLEIPMTVVTGDGVQEHLGYAILVTIVNNDILIVSATALRKSRFRALCIP